MEIKILGPGCPTCKQVENTVREAAAQAGVDAEITKVTDFKEIASHGVLSTPGVVVDGELKCSGRPPSKEEVLEWISS
jgi:small redox-active disulfide protein 2